MNFRENHARTKDEIKKNFLAFFKTKDVAHLATENLKESKQTPGETVREYDKRFKDLLSQIPYTIDVNLLVQWYVADLLHHIRAPLRMHEIKTLEKDLKKAQQMESDVDINSPSDIGRLEEKIEMLHQIIKDMSLCKYNLWCSNYREEGHTKDT